PDSVPFFTPSPQLGGWHRPLPQTPLSQSVLLVQVSPSSHKVGQPPPQSTAASVPFLTPSLQLGGWQTLPVQTPLWQSRASAQPCSTAHGEHSGPPQSTSVSIPFSTSSPQAALWQASPSTPWMHTPSTQSAFTRHFSITSHLSGQVPPQSTSVSSPFRMSSWQSAATQRMFVLQFLLMQSSGCAHRRSSAHGPHDPPQSTSVSSWFWIVSSQEASLQAPSSHSPLSHWASSLHSVPAAQRAQLPAGSPQSPAPSPWFCLPSLQVAGTHTMPSQLPLSQCASSPQGEFSGHSPQLPPQSGATSSSSCTPLMQVAL